MAMVGIGPIFSLIHDIAATGTSVIFGLLMLAIYWLVPSYMRAFYAMSVTMIAVILMSALLKVMGIFNLVGLELAVFAMIALWVLFFQRNTQLLIAEVASTGDDVGRNLRQVEA